MSECDCQSEPHHPLCRVSMGTRAAALIEKHAGTLARLAMSERLDTLAANLVIAGALCAAWNEGVEYGTWVNDPYISADPAPFSPGCGRPAV